MQVPIPLPILRDLRCAHCHKFVTCGPVHVAPDSSIICGRCMRFAKRTYRNLAFEAVASIFYYPCHYWPQHCNDKLQWNESLDHEKNCPFQSSCSILCSRPGSFFKSERKLPLNGGINLEHVPEDVLGQLKCIACENYLSNGPVYIVIDGKNICHRCVHSNGYPKSSIRNLAYESIASVMIFPCIYRFRGCTIKMKFGRDMWNHEHECPYGQVRRKLSKKPSKTGVKEGVKERGVIQTHSGHIWGTITPHSALFAPPKTNNIDGQMVQQELNQMIKKKHKEDEAKSLDSQSMDSIGSTLDSLDNISRSTADNISRDNTSRDNISRDNISRSTADNISRDNVSRDNISRDNISRNSSRPSTRENYYVEEQFRPSISGYPSPHHKPSNFEMPRQSKLRREDLEEVAPLPTPTGYNKVPFNGYYQENMMKYGQYQYQEGGNLQYSTSFNYPPSNQVQIPVKKSESFRVGNKDIIEEIKERQNRKQKMKKEQNPYEECNNLQDIVHLHDEVFVN